MNFLKKDIIHGFKKSKSEDLLSLATKEFYLTFNNIFERVAMGTPLGPSLPNAFFSYHEQNWLNRCSLEYRPLYYQPSVEDKFVLYKSSDHLKQFQSYLNSCHVSMSFTIETEQSNKTSFLDVKVIC